MVFDVKGGCVWSHGSVGVGVGGFGGDMQAYRVPGTAVVYHGSSGVGCCGC